MKESLLSSSNYWKNYWREFFFAKLNTLNHFNYLLIPFAFPIQKEVLKHHTIRRSEFYLLVAISRLLTRVPAVSPHMVKNTCLLSYKYGYLRDNFIRLTNKGFIERIRRGNYILTQRGINVIRYHSRLYNRHLDDYLRTERLVVDEYKAMMRKRARRKKYTKRK